MSGNKFIQSKLRRGFFALAAGVCLLVTSQNAQGQEALRISMAGDLAAARQQADNSIGYYNLLLGPTAWRFSSGLALEYNDNVRLQQTGQGDEGDFIFRPNLNTQMHWLVTLKNSLDVSLGASYSSCLQHQDLSQVFITPGSGFSFDVDAGDFKINLHDRITITENAYENGGGGNSGGSRNLISLENTPGANALWDLDKAIANLGYDHVKYLSLSQVQQQPDATSENIFANAGLRVRPELLIRVEACGTLINYSQTSSSNSFATPKAVQWNGGLFGSSHINNDLRVRADAAYNVYTVVTPGVSPGGNAPAERQPSSNLNDDRGGLFSARRDLGPLRLARGLTLRI